MKQNSFSRLSCLICCLLSIMLFSEAFIGTAIASEKDLTGKPRMGVTITTISGEAVDKGLLPSGVYVMEVEQDSPAAAAGLQPYDIIVIANNRTIMSAEDLTSLISTLNSGDKVNLMVYRTGVDLSKAIQIPEGKYVNLTVSLNYLDGTANESTPATPVPEIANSDNENTVEGATYQYNYNLEEIRARYEELVANSSSDFEVYVKDSSYKTGTSSGKLDDQQFLIDYASGLEARWLLSENAPTNMSDEQTKNAYSKMVDAELKYIEKYKEIQLTDPLLDFLAHGYILALLNQKNGIENYYGTVKYEKLWTNDGYNVRATLLYLLNSCYKVVIDQKYQNVLVDFLTTGYLSIPQDPVKYVADFISRYSVTENNKEQNSTSKPTTTPAPTPTLNLSRYSVLSPNMKSENVRKMQEKLVSLGYLAKATGTYDRNTINAVHKFQLYNQLPVYDDASPKMQAILFSYPTSEIKIPDLEILDVGLSLRYSSLILRPTLMNNTDQKITSVRLRMKAYNYSGQRVVYRVLDIDDIKSHGEAQNYNLEYSTLEVNGLNLNPRKRMQLTGQKTIKPSQFSASDTNTAYIAIVGYQTDSGRIINIPENAQLWYGTDGSVKKWTFENRVSASPKVTKEIDATANSYSLGIYYSFIDNFFAEVIGVPMGGVYIDSFAYDSPIKYEGLVEGDIIVRIGDVWTTDEESLLVAKGLVEAGTPIRIQYIHRKELNEIEVVLR